MTTENTQWLFTERAHLMCPNMCFGIAAAIPSAYDEEKAIAALRTLSDAHPFLRALLGYEEKEDRYFYQITRECRTQLSAEPDAVTDIYAPAVLAEYERLTARDWDLRSEGMLKAAMWRMGEATCVLLVFHHLLADGRGALTLAQEFAELYAFGTEPDAAPETLIASAAEFPRDSRLPWISRMLVNKANRDWKKEGKALSYEAYHVLAQQFLETDRIRHSVTVRNGKEMQTIRQICHEKGISVNSYLLAEMMLSENTNKVIIACDLREKLSCYRQDALGNYSTAFSVAIQKPEKELLPLAAQAQEQVRRILSRSSALYLVLQCYAAMEPALLDAAFAAAKGLFDSKSANFIGTRFFGFGAAAGCSLTNLGRIESRAMASALFIPPASPAAHRTWGVVTVNDTMTICTAERD